jgi:hypothetical protein
VSEIMAQRTPLNALRQHHAIEHATMSLLNRRTPGLQLVARSDLGGFSVYGQVETVALAAMAEEALARLQAGESQLAIHPNCGTNLVTAGMLSGLAAFVAGSGRQRSVWDRLPAAILAATLALTAAIPLGRWMQTNVTTSPHVKGLRILRVEKLAETPVVSHRVSVG